MIAVRQTFCNGCAGRASLRNPDERLWPSVRLGFRFPTNNLRANNFTELMQAHITTANTNYMYCVLPKRPSTQILARHHGKEIHEGDFKEKAH
jgi:hypothetical protein